LVYIYEYALFIIFLAANINSFSFLKAFCDRGRLLSYFGMDKEDPKVKGWRFYVTFP
jgi:hypothetical protein